MNEHDDNVRTNLIIKTDEHPIRIDGWLAEYMDGWKNNKTDKYTDISAL